MLYNVLQRLSADTGLHLTQKRSVLLKHLQNAASEMYDLLECNKILREVTLVVPNNKVVSLPPFIGELKGMRKHTWERTVDLKNLSTPRFVSNTIGYQLDNWRDMGESPTQVSLTQVGPVVVHSTPESTPVVLKVCGQTNEAARDEEEITLDDTEITSTKLFGPTIFSICCFSARSADIKIYDVSDVELAVLYTDQTNTRYKIVDVSQYSWPEDTLSSEALIDVLYKVPKYTLDRDSDSFYAGDSYDDAWYAMAMHCYFDSQENRKQDSVMFRGRALNMLQEGKNSTESGQVKKISFGRNKFHNLFWPEYYVK